MEDRIMKSTLQCITFARAIECPSDHVSMASRQVSVVLNPLPVLYLQTSYILSIVHVQDVPVSVQPQYHKRNPQIKNTHFGSKNRPFCQLLRPSLP